MHFTWNSLLCSIRCPKHSCCRHFSKAGFLFLFICNELFLVLVKVKNTRLPSNLFSQVKKVLYYTSVPQKSLGFHSLPPFLCSESQKRPCLLNAVLYTTELETQPSASQHNTTMSPAYAKHTVQPSSSTMSTKYLVSIRVSRGYGIGSYETMPTILSESTWMRIQIALARAERSLSRFKTFYPNVLEKHIVDSRIFSAVGYAEWERTRPLSLRNKGGGRSWCTNENGGNLGIEVVEIAIKVNVSEINDIAYPEIQIDKDVKEFLGEYHNISGQPSGDEDDGDDGDGFEDDRLSDISSCSSSNN